MTGYDHLDRRVEIAADVRDRLRDELGAYGCGTIMLDGISRDTHQELLTNGMYHLTQVTHEVALPTQDEVLFELTTA